MRKGWGVVRTHDASLSQRRHHVFKVGGVQFLGLGYCREQNMHGIPSFVHCSLLRNGNHTLHQKVGVVRPNFGGPDPPPPVVAPLRPTVRRHSFVSHLSSAAARSASLILSGGLAVVTTGRWSPKSSSPSMSSRR